MASVLVAFAAVVSIGIHVDLADYGLRPPAEALATAALDRVVKFEGPMILVPTWSPTLEVHGLSIGNPKGRREPRGEGVDPLHPAAPQHHPDCHRLRLGVAQAELRQQRPNDT